MGAPSYLPLAFLVLLAHVGIALFLLGGLLSILVGRRFGWLWVRSFRFRLFHLGAVFVVAAESWLGIPCPLTLLENRLRSLGGATPYGGGFIEHWLRSLLYFDAPAWVFTLCYSLFALAVMAAWRLFPPRPAGGGSPR